MGIVDYEYDNNIYQRLCKEDKLIRIVLRITLEMVY